jgi:orotate phosphoribosyltransferase
LEAFSPICPERPQGLVPLASGSWPLTLEAGRRLAEHLTDFENRDDLVVLGLPWGGVPVAYEVATRLFPATGCSVRS